MTLLKKPTSTDVADQCREMGLVVGDTIEGREFYGDTWNDARLTLLFVGAQAAVFDVWSRCTLLPDWEHDGEDADWLLNCREWSRVPAPVALPQITNEGHP